MTSAYPIVFCPGFMGWNSDETGLGKVLNYWGKNESYIKKLRKEGFNVYEGAVGPISSVWDRAIELYYCIHGGTVDYGIVHSTRHGHARFGRTCPGFGFDWSATHKINLFGHSMGGSTIRLLTSLLNQGSEEEREAYRAANEEVPIIFQGGHDFVFSVTCLNTAHSGTQLANSQIISDIAKTAVAAIASLAGLDTDDDTTVFDFRLEHFGLQRELGEEYTSYLKRVQTSHIWHTAVYEDLAGYAVSSAGTEMQNRLYPAEKHVYYFNLASASTYSVPIMGISIPRPTMSLIMWPTATFLGRTPLPGCDQTGSYENDGMAPFCSQIGPQIGATDTIVSLAAVSQLVPGTIYFTRIDNTLDHVQVLGFGPHDVFPGYLNYVRFIGELGAAGSVGSRMKDALGTGFGATPTWACVVYHLKLMLAVAFLKFRVSKW